MFFLNYWILILNLPVAAIFCLPSANQQYNRRVIDQYRKWYRCTWSGASRPRPWTPSPRIFLCEHTGRNIWNGHSHWPENSCQYMLPYTLLSRLFLQSWITSPCNLIKKQVSQPETVTNMLVSIYRLKLNW